MKTASILSSILALLFCIGICSSAQAQPKWRIAKSGTATWQDQPVGSGWAIPIHSYHDFDGDGKTDIFTAKNGQFLYSSAGKTTWKTLNSRYAHAGLTSDDLRFGDFNGDKKMDVFFKYKGYYGYVSVGNSQFIRLRKADVPLNQLGFGDFNGDGKTDIFWQR